MGDALQQCRRDGPYWVCATALYHPADTPLQSMERQLGEDPSAGPFATALAHATCTVCVLTSACSLYTRLWCLFEMIMSVQLDVPIEVASRVRISGATGQGQSLLEDVCVAQPVDSAKAKC